MYITTSSMRLKTPQAKLTSSYEVCLAKSPRVRQDAFRLRYQSYHSSGFIQANPDQIFRDRYDELPNSVTMVVYAEGQPVASARLCFLSSAGGMQIPSSDTFPDQVRALLATCGASRTGSEAVEITRLVRSPGAANNQGLVFLLYRMFAVLGVERDIRVVLSCVRQNHVAFYRRMGFREVAAPRPYPGLSCPMSLLACSREDHDAMRSNTPLLNPNAFPEDDVSTFLAGGMMATSLRPHQP